METCYRHPTRETGVSCSNCGRPICTECMTATSVGMRCPECARQKTKVRTASSIGADEPVVTYALIAINVVVALGVLLGGAGTGGGGLGASPLFTNGALSRVGIDQGDYWRLVTGGFLHDGLPHLFFNMFSLFILGRLLEPAVGRLRFGLIYAVSLLTGAFGALLVTPDAPTVGASAAVFGLMGATVVVMRNRGVNPMQSGLAFWIGLNLLFTFTVPNISIGGHIGGLVGGALAAFVLFDVPQRVRGASQQVVLGVTALIGVAAVVASVVISSGAAAPFGG